MKKADASRMWWIGGLLAGVAAIAGLIVYEVEASAASSSSNGSTVIASGQTYAIPVGVPSTVVANVGAIFTITLAAGSTFTSVNVTGTAVTQVKSQGTGNVVTFNAIATGSGGITAVDSNGTTTTATITVQ